MKMNDHKFSEQDPDLRIFDYLEGNLPPSLTSQLESQATYDDSLEEELNSWKATFIEQEFHNTELLEQKLHQIPSVINKNVTTNFYFPSIAILTIMLSFTPLSFERYNNVASEHVVTLESKDIGKSEKQNLSPDLSNFAPIIDIKEVADRATIMSPIDKHTEENREFSEISPLEPLKEAESNHSVYINTKIAFVKEPVEKSNSVPKNEAPKRSKKMRRAIEKFKEKALQERRAMEFIKGNKPYVVPLNTNF